jgi:subtilase family serine protease
LKERLYDAVILAAILVLFVLSPFMLVTAYSPTGDTASSAIHPNPAIISSANSIPICAPTSICPAMLDKAYGFSTLQTKGTNGSGQTIVIDDACGDPTLSSDLNVFDLQFGLSAPKLNVIDFGGIPCIDTGWSLETSLDVEWAHVTSPGAAITVLVASIPNPQDMYGAWTYALTNHLGNQISNSYGGAGCYNGYCNDTIGQGIGSCTSTKGTEGVNVASILTLARKDHITVLASSGDSGATGQGTAQEETIPDDCSGVLTVGGTTLTIDSSGNYIDETAWNGLTGGGYTTNGEPKYQSTAKIVDPYNALAKPDVSAVADPNTGVWIYNQGDGGWLVIGGTSLSCPLWAGFIADVNQIRAAHGLEPAGFINQFLYSIVYGVGGTSSLYNKDFHDILTGNNNPWPAGKGWDPDTGLGSFIAPALANTLGTSASA